MNLIRVARSGFRVFRLTVIARNFGDEAISSKKLGTDSAICNGITLNFNKSLNF